MRRKSKTKANEFQCFKCGVAVAIFQKADKEQFGTIKTYDNWTPPNEKGQVLCKKCSGI